MLPVIQSKYHTSMWFNFTIVFVLKFHFHWNRCKLTIAMYGHSGYKNGHRNTETDNIWWDSACKFNDDHSSFVKFANYLISNSSLNAWGLIVEKWLEGNVKQQELFGIRQSHSQKIKTDLVSFWEGQRFTPFHLIIKEIVSKGTRTTTRKMGKNHENIFLGIDEF